jgi:hypothetical protein
MWDRGLAHLSWGWRRQRRHCQPPSGSLAFERLGAFTRRLCSAERIRVTTDPGYFARIRRIEKHHHKHEGETPMPKSLLRWLIIPGIVLFSPTPVLPFLSSAFGIDAVPATSPLRLLLIPMVLAGYGLLIAAFVVAVIQAGQRQQTGWLLLLIITGIAEFLLFGIASFFFPLLLFIGPLVVLVYSMMPQRGL